MKRMPGTKIAGLIALAALAAASTARAGSITGVTAPPTAVVGHPVTITIQGRGPCSAVTVNYNTAGTTVLTFPVVSFPFSPSAHPYAAAGTKTILVTATGNCAGRAMTTISVIAPPPPPPPPTGVDLSSLAALCARIGCGLLPGVLWRPALTGATRSVGPGQMLTISGSFLGSSAGSVRVRLPNGSPASVMVTSWTSSVVTGTLDPRISGVGDGDAQVVVQRADSVMSNSLTVHFVAWRDRQLVPPRYVTVLTCADAAVITQCDASNHIFSERIDFARIGGGSLRSPGQPAGDASYSGDHVNFWDDFGASGTDRIRFDLPEGFVLDPESLAIVSDAFATSEGRNASVHTTLPAAGTRSGTITVGWSLNGGNSEMPYGGILMASGPIGIPLAP